MRARSEAERALLDDRRRRFAAFVAEAPSVIVDLAQRLHIARPLEILSEPERLLDSLDEFMRNVDFDGVDAERKMQLHLCVAVYVAQLLIRRHGGAWTLEENPDSKFFGRYVVGCSDGVEARAPMTADTFEMVHALFEEPRGQRRLLSLIDEIERDVRQYGANAR